MSFQRILGRISLHEAVIALAVLSAVYLQLQNFADDPGVGWHLETGRWVLEHRMVPSTDPFLATPPGALEEGQAARSWISDQWLSDVVLELLFQVGSWPLVYASLTSLYLITYFVVLYGGLRKLHMPALAATFAVMCAFKGGQIHFILRPVMFSFLFFTIVYLRCLYTEQQMLNTQAAQEPSRPNDKSYFAWAALFALWANIHPGFVIGLAMVGLSGAITGLRAIFYAPLRAQIVPAGLTFLSCAIGTLLNPYGLKLHESIASLRASDYFMSLHEEWMPISFESPEGRLWLMLVILIGLCVLFGRGKFRFPSPTSLVACVVLGLSCLDAVRMLPFFAIAASLPVACGFASLGQCSIFQRSRPFARLASAFMFFERREHTARAGIMLTAVICGALIASSLLRGDLLLFQGPFGPRVEKFPYGAIQFLSAHQDSESKRELVVASIPEWGGFLSKFGTGMVRPLIDDRNTLVGEDFHKRYSSYIGGANGWDTFFVLLGADALLVPSGGVLAKALQQGPVGEWSLSYQDRLQTLATKTTS